MENYAGVRINYHQQKRQISFDSPVDAMSPLPTRAAAETPNRPFLCFCVCIYTSVHGQSGLLRSFVISAVRSLN